MKTRCTPASLARPLGTSLALICCLLMCGTARGQQPADGVRVIDLKWIMDHHTRYLNMINSFKQDFDTTARRIQEEGEAIRRLEEGLKQYVPGSVDYKRLDEDVSTKKANWGLQANRQQKEFRIREAEIYWQEYNEIQAAVKTYCERNNVTMVVQFRGEQLDPRKPEGVLAAMTRPVLYVSPSRDITPMILDMVNQGAPMPPTAQRPQGVPER